MRAELSETVPYVCLECFFSVAIRVLVECAATLRGPRLNRATAHGMEQCATEDTMLCIEERKNLLRNGVTP